MITPLYHSDMCSKLDYIPKMRSVIKEPIDLERFGHGLS